MSDKPIENLAVGWLPGVNVPAHPHDAVNGATTPGVPTNDIEDEDEDDDDVCHHGVGFDEYCEDCEEEDEDERHGE